MYVLEHSYEQVDQQYIGHEQIAGHDGWDNPGAGLTGGQGDHHPVLCGDVLPTGGCTAPTEQKHTFTVNHVKRLECLVMSVKICRRQMTCRQKKIMRDRQNKTQAANQTNDKIKRQSQLQLPKKMHKYMNLQTTIHWKHTLFLFS